MLPNALIIGGGIAGPATALALQKAGIDSVVYEAHSDVADGVGSFLTLGSNGIDALRVLDADRVLAAGFPTPQMHIVTAGGKVLGSVSTGQTLPDGTTSRTMKRTDLYRGLRDEALRRGIRFEYGKRLVDAHESGHGVRAVFEDGSQAEGAVLIGCDGIHSRVRYCIDSAAPRPGYVGLIGSGGYTSGVEIGGRPGDYRFVFGKRAFFGYATGPDDEVWWFANCPHPVEPARGAVLADGDAAVRAYLTELFADDAGPALPLIAGGREILPLTPIHYLPHLPRWHGDRMIVIGDAAHAPSPSSGQGASLAVEDAVMLAKCLRDNATPRAAFEMFVATRRPRVERIIRQAARINRNKAAGPLSRVFIRLFLPLILNRMADGEQWRQTYDYHIDWAGQVYAS
ncbi:FAD-dependent oxidoreductase [Nocardia arthritidis]|nr:NAD(P)/FAD-dependent oxidoreductase [Nocardia arthritidis]